MLTNGNHIFFLCIGKHVLCHFLTGVKVEPKFGVEQTRISIVLGDHHEGQIRAGAFRLQQKKEEKRKKTEVDTSNDRGTKWKKQFHDMCASAKGCQWTNQECKKNNAKSTMQKQQYKTTKQGHLAGSAHSPPADWLCVHRLCERQFCTQSRRSCMQELHCQWCGSPASAHLISVNTQRSHSQ